MLGGLSEEKSFRMEERSRGKWKNRIGSRYRPSSRASPIRSMGASSKKRWGEMQCDSVVESDPEKKTG